MKNYLRRRFLGSSTAAVAGLGFAGFGFGQNAAGTTSGPGPDLMVQNARIYTMSPAAPRAEALAITLDQALQVATVNAAYAAFEENVKGSIEAGKLTDFVILGQDPHDADPDHIKEIPVVRTVVGGKTMFLRDG
jgi:predicted amidohydrolase YtcJ